MRAISERALKVVTSGGRYSDRCILTIPGSSPMVLNTSPGWSVAEKSVVAGPRLSAQSVTLLAPASGVDDLFALAGYPGAVFDLDIGVSLGSSIEWIRCLHGFAVEGSSQRNRLGVSVSLVDAWARSDRASMDPVATTVGQSRASVISGLFTPVNPGLTVITTADGGTISQAGVFTDSRSQAASTLATDGRLQTGFNADGALVIKAKPALVGALAPDWIFRGGVDGVVVRGSAERTRSWADSEVNAVRVVPGGSWQTWDAQTARLADTSNPLHVSNLGYEVVKEITSNTAVDACEALTIAEYELTRLLQGPDEHVRLSIPLNPAVEADDTMLVALSRTVDDLGWSATHIITSVTHAPSQGITQLEGVSAAGYDIGM